MRQIKPCSACGKEFEKAHQCNIDLCPTCAPKCANCGDPLKRQGKYCSKPGCVVARNAAQWQGIKANKPRKHCRHCGADISGKLYYDWCKNNPECQEARRKHFAQLNADYRKRYYGYTKAEIQTRGCHRTQYVPTGRKCNICGKEIHRIIDAQGVVVFDWRYTCSNCVAARAAKESIYDMTWVMA